MGLYKDASFLDAFVLSIDYGNFSLAMFVIKLFRYCFSRYLRIMNEGLFLLLLSLL